MKLRMLLLSMLIFLSGCASSPQIAPAVPIYPQIPALRKIEEAKLSENYVEKMQKILQTIVLEPKN